MLNEKFEINSTKQALQPFAVLPSLNALQVNLKYIYAFNRCFYPKRLKMNSGYTVCVPWELNPQPFALLTQCSTTEPQKHKYMWIKMCSFKNIDIKFKSCLQPC